MCTPDVHAVIERRKRENDKGYPSSEIRGRQGASSGTRVGADSSIIVSNAIRNLNSPRVLDMRIGLFVPCYVDQFYPDVAMATVEVLERYGVEVDFPAEQTCCGQPMANTGCQHETRPLAQKFLKIFRDYPYVVCPSGSCVAMVRHHYGDYLQGAAGFRETGSQHLRAVRVSGGRVEGGADRGVVSASRRDPPELPCPAGAASGTVPAS